MYKLSFEERDALDLIMCCIEDFNCCNMETYDSAVHHSQALNNELYYNSTNTDMHCFKSTFGNHPLEVTIKSIDPENMGFQIYPKNDNGTRIINFIYNFDYTNSDEEPYDTANYRREDFTIELYDTEEEYFQASTLYELALSPEENQMFIDFNNSFTQHLINRTGEKHYGKSTS